MTDQQQKSGPVHARVAGAIKICPLCGEIRDRWWTLEQHVETKHSRELHIPADASDDE